MSAAPPEQSAAAASSSTAPRVAVIGGGLAGLAAAVGLARRGLQVELFEARRQLGGRAASFTDPSSGELVDYCQHVSLGCCTNLDDFCQRVGASDMFRRDRVLHLFTRDGRSSRLCGTRLLPAPLHLAPSLFRLHFLSWRERQGIARAMLQLARVAPEELADKTAAAWLSAAAQSRRAIDCFWGAVLTSALGESVERASMLHARKVFVDAYLSSSTGYELFVPRVSLSELYDRRLAAWFAAHEVTLALGTAAEEIEQVGGGLQFTAGGTHRRCDAVVIAVPWHRARALLSPAMAAALPEVPLPEQIDAAPIAGVHLWFDRPLTELPHAAFVDMLSQWLFRRDDLAAGQGGGEHYYQVVISASRQIAGRAREDVVAEICTELRSVFPATREAKLLRSKVVNDPAAVFSVRPGIESLRPPQATQAKGVFLAGDWTRTGWPATMEGAVRSGYLAAEAVLQYFGRPAKLLAPDMPRGWLARRVVG